MFKKLFNNSNPKYPEATGYYDNIPTRIKQWVLTKNEEGVIIFETTDKSICESKDRVKLIIECAENNEWIINRKQSYCVTSLLHTTNEITDSDISRNRALWHAKEIMIGNKRSHKERYSKYYATKLNKDTNVYNSDPFFDKDTETQINPFNRFLDS